VIHAFTRSAKEVSGDFYDFVEIDKDRTLVVIGDASGKGIPACMVMAMTRSFIRANIDRYTGLENMLEELNSNLYRDTATGRFITLGCCLLDRNLQTVEFARAGHTELIIYSSKYKLRKIHPGGTALGLMPKNMAGNYDVFKFTFKPYYSMLLFSDGIIDANNAAGEEFGQERLEKIFYDSCEHKNPPIRSAEGIMSAIENFTAGQQQGDDQTIVVISHKDAFVIK
jgi:serine phosphatase RsbU (regulator of sigma subunit)